MAKPKKDVKSVQEYIEKTTLNIESDRALASQLLYSLMTNLNATPDTRTHRYLGEVASKYLETLQRSNEQLVRLTALVHKIEEDSKDSDRMTQEDLEELYDGMNTKR
jgi:transposase